MQCRHCNAKMWYNERISKDKNTASPKFSLCCGDVKVELPLLQNPLKYLERLLFDDNATDSKNYQHNIRTYNMMFSFTSVGIKLDKTINETREPPTIRIQGQPCHRISSLLPMPGKQPKFAQLYMFDTQNEVENRINTMSQHAAIQPHIVSTLSQMLDDHNVHAKSFRMARDRLADIQVDNVKLRLIAVREKDGRTYNLPNVSEVAALIVGLQYHLLFPYGEDGYRPDILHRSTSGNKKRKRNHLTMREWFAYRLQSRSNEAQTLLYSRKLFQQFIVKACTMVKVNKYCSLQTSLDARTSNGSSKGERVILPSTFVGSPRYMDQLYFDGMAICSHVGFPNLFITLTGNPNWPEIYRVLAPLNLKATDRPDLISRVFRLKYEHMLSDLTKKHMLGKAVAYMHTIEFKKRGLPNIISEEIPSHENDPELYTLVQNHMVHDPCRILQSKSPCMKEGKCSCFYPKMFQPQTLLDSNGYPVYHRRNDGRTISKNGIIIDNRYIVPYNAKLLRKYQAHINIEWCNQSTFIKYLFKYINKGYDRVTAVVVYDANGALENPITQNDEIKEYVDCRIFGFPIHARKPVVERLHFHLSSQHNVLYEDDDDIEDILSKPSISNSKLLAWMNSNKCFSEGRNLTYSQFVSKFVYNQKARSWNLRKKGNTIGRLIWVPPITEELFYLRMMLTTCNGPTSFEDIRTVENVLYPTYRETCFVMGFLQDYREFVEAIKEAKDWDTTNYLRKLFVLVLLTASSLRAKKQIVIMVASSGIASLLLPGGRIAHSKFKIPVPIFEDSTCNILQGKKNLNQIFGGKVIVFGGDFRQILPVIPRGSRSDIINATINSSYLWPSCQVLTLTKNMRLQANAQSVDDQEIAKFAKWILDIGDGVIGNENDGYATVEIPEYLLITEYNDPIDAIVRSTFPNLYQHHSNLEFFKCRAILASTNETVEEVNDYILSLILGEHMEYLSFDCIDKSESIESWHFQSITTEFLNSLNTFGLPNHCIKLKISSPIILLRNLDQTQGLCNGTRLVVTRLAKHVIAAEIISGKNPGHNVYIPRMSMLPSQSPWPFKLLRRQFPIMLSYAMTINKSQGQSLSMVGLYLPKLVFSHG
uniref:ATP-dependent DNA helicase n=1 Tax=Glycine max TaxID=3847 RepID=A0A0R0KGW9_SOYBN